MNYAQDLYSNKVMFFNFMKEKYRIYQNSNIFFRDIQYAIKSYYEKKEQRIKYAFAEKLAHEFLNKLENEGQIKKISENAWKVNFSLTSVVTYPTEVIVEKN
jgi:hypothetical protein